MVSTSANSPQSNYLILYYIHNFIYYITHLPTAPPPGILPARCENPMSGKRPMAFSGIPKIVLCSPPLKLLSYFHLPWPSTLKTFLTLETLKNHPWLNTVRNPKKTLKHNLDMILTLASASILLISLSTHSAWPPSLFIYIYCTTLPLVWNKALNADFKSWSIPSWILKLFFSFILNLDLNIEFTLPLALLVPC